MIDDPVSLLEDSVVRESLRIAWLDSNPGVIGGHEEGGFILRDSSGIISIVRWPGGGQDQIGLPPHPNCRIGDLSIVASFHTHPNTGPNYQQEPSETDKRAVRDDTDLKAPTYIGEFVISNDRIYRVAPDGLVSDIADTACLFARAGGTES